MDQFYKHVWYLNIKIHELFSYIKINDNVKMPNLIMLRKWWKIEKVNWLFLCNAANREKIETTAFTQEQK